MTARRDERVDAARVGGDPGIVQMRFHEAESIIRIVCRVVIDGLVSGEGKIPDIGIGALDGHCLVLRIEGHEPVPGSSVRALEIARSLGGEDERPPTASRVEILGANEVGTDQHPQNHEAA